MIDVMVPWFLYFIIYSFLGWVCECIYCSIPVKHFINRGFLSGPYCPIYGLGATAVIYMLSPFLAQPLLLFIFGVLITSVLEYVTSWIMEALFQTKWWDYSTYFANLHGRICLKNSTLFGILVMVVMYGIHPMIMDGLSLFPNMHKALFAFAFLCYFSFDVYRTTISLLHRNKIFNELEDAMEELKQALISINTYQSNTLQERLLEALTIHDADERIVKITRQVAKKMELPKTYAKLKTRLEKAFPNQHLSATHATMESLLHTIQEFLKQKP